MGQALMVVGIMPQTVRIVCQLTGVCLERTVNGRLSLPLLVNLSVSVGTGFQKLPGGLCLTSLAVNPMFFMKSITDLFAGGRYALSCGATLLCTMFLVQPHLNAAPIGGEISGYVELDPSGSGGEQERYGLENRTVYLYDADEELYAQTTTDSEGYYSFTELLLGQYTVHFGETESFPYYISSVRYSGKDSLGNTFGEIEMGDNVEFEWPDFYDYIDLNYLHDLYPDFYVIVELPFAFPYYGKSYSRIVIAENGYVSFDFDYHYVHGEIGPARGPIFEQTACTEPLGVGYEADASYWSDSGWLADGCHDYGHCWGASAIIAPLMANLESRTDTCWGEYDDGLVRYGIIGDAFVVEWANVSVYETYGSTNYTFRAYLYPNGEIRFEYNQMENCVYGEESEYYNWDLELCDSTIYGSAGLEGPYENSPLVVQDFRNYCGEGSSSDGDYYGCGDEDNNFVRSSYGILFRPSVEQTISLTEDAMSAELEHVVSYYYPATMSGYIYFDSDESGFFDWSNDEVITDGIVVYVDLNGNNVRDEDEPYTLSNEYGYWEFYWDAHSNEGIYLPAGTYTFRQDLSYTPQYQEIPERSLLVSSLNLKTLLSEGLAGVPFAAPLSEGPSIPPLLQLLLPSQEAGTQLMSLLHYRYPAFNDGPQLQGGEFEIFDFGFFGLDLTAIVNLGGAVGEGSFLGFQTLVSGLGSNEDGLYGSGIYSNPENPEGIPVFGLADINPFVGTIEPFAAYFGEGEEPAPKLLNAPFTITPLGAEGPIDFAFGNDVLLLLMGLLSGGEGENEFDLQEIGATLLFNNEGEMDSIEYFPGIFVAGSTVDSWGNVWVSCIDLTAFDMVNAENPILFVAQLEVEVESIAIGERFYIPTEYYGGIYDIYHEVEEFVPSDSPEVLLLTLLGTIMQGLAWDPVYEEIVLPIFSLDFESLFFNECGGSLLDLFAGGPILVWYPEYTYESEWYYYDEGSTELTFADMFPIGVIPPDYIPMGAEIMPVTGFTVTLCEDSCGECGTEFYFLNRSAGAVEPEGNIIFVDAASTAFDPDGTSWSNAFPTLQEGLAEAQARMDDLIQNPPQEPVDPLQVWVASGTYTTASGVFTLVDGVSVYGGFDKTEAVAEDRDMSWFLASIQGGTATGTTVLEGTGTTHVVVASGVGSETLFDGFIVTGGNANVGSQSDSYGGGLYGVDTSLTISNSLFTENTARYYGGAVYLEDGTATIINTAFLSNTVSFDGAAIYLKGGNHTVDACWFQANTASYNGGALMLNTGSLVLTNSVFGYNTSGRYGGAIQLTSSTAAAKANPATLLRNNTFYGNGVLDTRGNPTGYGGALSNDRYVKAVVENNIFWANRARTSSQIYSMAVANITVRYNTIQGNYSPSSFTKLQDPYLDPVSFEIMNPNSTAIDGGSVDVEPYDFYGMFRVTRDLGAIAFDSQVR